MLPTEETLKDAFLVCGCDAHACVAHIHLYFPVLGMQAYFYFSVCGRLVIGIIHQVVNDLPHTL